MRKPFQIHVNIPRDPRGHQEKDWLNMLDFLVARLSEATRSRINLGAYWCEDNPKFQGSGLGAQVRSRNPYPLVESDCWEATLCFSQNAQGSYAGTCAFPFLQGSAVTPEGRLADLGRDAFLKRFRSLSFQGGTFVDEGWHIPDGPGEWGWIRQPGDDYRQLIEITMPTTLVEFGHPIRVWLNGGLPPSRQLSPLARISLLSINRNHEGKNLVPWSVRTPRSNSAHVITVSQLKVVHYTGLEVDLAQFKIRGGWKSGRYQAVIRVQNCHSSQDWTYSSDISAPFKFTIH
ncbi:MAG: hypothetical protein K1Y36_08655 [Blastocatellia bacterium]|nr:hypothetical protein [Blastocatellia bacterium]